MLDSRCLPLCRTSTAQTRARQALVGAVRIDLGCCWSAHAAMQHLPVIGCSFIHRLSSIRSFVTNPANQALICDLFDRLFVFDIPAHPPLTEKKLMAPQDVLTIDPVAMNVVNRVCAGSQLNGEHLYNGGLLVQGNLAGTMDIRGCLIIWNGAQVSGRIKVWGDLYLFGQLGQEGQSSASTNLECMGTAYIASTGVSRAALFAYRIRMYDGAQLHGPFKTLKDHMGLPELHDLARS